MQPTYLSTRVLSINYVFDPNPKMSLIGYIFNKLLQKNIPVYISESGPGFKHLTAAISQNVKIGPLAKVKEQFENGTLFKDHNLKLMEQLIIGWGIAFELCISPLLTMTSNMSYVPYTSNF